MATPPKSVRKADHPELAALDERKRASDEASLETLRRMESARPTPTQEENDLAKLGALDLDAPKADDGSGPELVHVRSVVPADQAPGAGYRVRAAAPASSTSPAPAQPPRPAATPERK